MANKLRIISLLFVFQTLEIWAAVPPGYSKICDDLNDPAFWFNDICYMLMKRHKSFGKAEKNCKSLPFGHLVTEGPNAAIYEHIRINYNYAGSSDAIWIGAQQTSNETTFEDWEWLVRGGPNEPIEGFTSQTIYTFTGNETVAYNVTTPYNVTTKYNITVPRNVSIPYNVSTPYQVEQTISVAEEYNVTVPYNMTIYNTTTYYNASTEYNITTWTQNVTLWNVTTYYNYSTIYETVTLQNVTTYSNATGTYNVTTEYNITVARNVSMPYNVSSPYQTEENYALVESYNVSLPYNETTHEVVTLYDVITLYNVTNTTQNVTHWNVTTHYNYTTEYEIVTMENVTTHYNTVTYYNITPVYNSTIMYNDTGFWSPGQPDNGGGLEQCGAWRYSAPGSGFGDEICTDENYFLCQLTVMGDPDTEFDCSSIPDGVYENPADHCSKLYYECLAGKSYYRSCDLGTKFSWETSQCEDNDDILGCSCGWEYNSRYVPETRSCIYHNSKVAGYRGDPENWYDAFVQCGYLARMGWKAGADLYGRLAHVTTPAVAETIDIWPEGYVGAMKLDTNHSGLSWYNWFRVADNPNSRLPVALVSTPATSGGVDMTRNESMCMVANTTDNAWLEKSCYEKRDFFCEEFYNICEVVSCPPPTTCVPNVLKSYECLCPGSKIGENCTLPDVEEPCTMIAGRYSVDTLSCFKKGEKYGTWYEDFQSCAQPPLPNFFSRLAHVRTESAWELIKYDGYWLGHRTLIADSNDINDWYWFPDPFNPNYKVPHDFKINSSKIVFDGSGEDCGRMNYNNWRDESCALKKGSGMCEHYLDACKLENVTCAERQECIPDTPYKATCVCISPFTGPNCDQYDMEPLCTLRGLSYNATANRYSCYTTYIEREDDLNDRMDTCRNLYQFRDVETRLAVVTNKYVQDYLNVLFAATGKWNAVVGLASDTSVPHEQASWGVPKAVYDSYEPLQPMAPVSYTPPGGVIIKERPPSNTKPYCAYMNFAQESWILKPCYHNDVEDGLTTCEIYVETACDSFPCMHGGVCNAIFPDNYTCSCEFPFYGQNCEQSHMCDPGMNPCLNGATCQPTYPEEYQCFCEPPYYGYDCQNYCNTTVWSEWSECSQSCDFGWEYRSQNTYNTTPTDTFIPMASKENDFCHPTVKEYESCNAMQCQTDWTFAGHDQTPYYDECMSKDGFYTGAGCYFFAKSTAPDGIAWDESFGLCETEGAQIGHVYDTHQLLQAISNFLFAKHPPDTKVWLGARGPNFVYWMDSPTTFFTKAIISSSRPPAMTGYYCLARSATQLKVNHTEIHPYLTHGMECNTKDPLDPVGYALCMIPTPFADFKTYKHHYMTGHSSANPISTTAEGPWFCGLQCRYTKGCVSYNYRTSTQSCQMFRAKLGMPEYIDTDGGTDNIYTLNYDTDCFCQIFIVVVFFCIAKYIFLHHTQYLHFLHIIRLRGVIFVLSVEFFSGLANQIQLTLEFQKHGGRHAWLEKSCYEKRDFFCEEFYNICEVVSCPPPTTCVPNVLKSYECLCPGSKIGENCTLPDVEEPCTMIAGRYSVDTLSCFKKGEKYGTWYEDFQSCAQPPLPNFFSRLAHVRTESAWELIKYDGYWLGHRTLIADSNDINDWYWFPDPFNPNYKVPHDFKINSSKIVFDGSGEDCGRMNYNNWRDESCALKKGSGMCEHYLDACKLENVTCAERQECIPDTPYKATCVCISPFTGPNCDQYDMEPLCTLRGLSYNATANRYSCYTTYIEREDDLNDRMDTCRNLYQFRDVETRLAVVTNKYVQDYLNVLFAATGKWNAVVGLASDTSVPHEQASWGVPKAVYDSYEPLQPMAPVSYTPPGGVIIKERPPSNTKPYCAYMNFAQESWILKPCYHNDVEDGLTTCEIYVETACDSFPCMHGGVCNAIFPDNYTCSCEFPFYGQNCEQSHMCDPGMNPCLNGATCQPTYPEEYQCFCEPPYYGYDCQNYCNTTVWSEWSECSQSCDFGWEYRSQNTYNTTPTDTFIPMASKENDFCHPTVKEYESCNAMQCQTDWTFAGHDQTPYYDECMSKDGFYTGAGCYFFAKSTAPDGIAWDESFGLCETEGAQIGHVYDTHQLLQAISNFLFAKHPPDTKVWLGARGPNFVYWMDSPTTFFTKAIISSSRPPAMTGYYCLARSATQLKVNHTEIHPYLTHGMECNTKDPLDPVGYALCMIPTPFADFKTYKHHYMTGHSSANPISTTAEGPWFCGLQCRYTKGCVSYNYRTSTQSCQMFRAKLGMPEYIDTDGGTDNIYTLNYDTDWSFYNRNY